jgi:hypothetical protein
VSGPPEYFARIPERVFGLLQSKRVVVVGVGTVGSRIAEYLANCTIGHLRLIDHDALKIENLYRHALPKRYLGWNKAVGLADYLSKQVTGLHAEPVARELEQEVPGELLERWLADADLIVAATDDRQAQRRIGLHALALGIPAIFPGQYVHGGGEVIVQSDNRLPCMGCWDYFRTDEDQLRGVLGLPFAELPVIYTSLRLCLGILDPESEHRDMMVPEGGIGPPYQVFSLDRSGRLRSATLMRRQNCPSCAGGPSPPRDLPAPPPTPTPPAPPVGPAEHPRGKTNLIFSVIEGIHDLIEGTIAVILICIGLILSTLATGIFALFADAFWPIAGAFLCVGALWVCVELLTLLITGHFAPG